MTRILVALITILPALAQAQPADDDVEPGAPHDGWRLDAKLGGSDGKDNGLPDGYGLGIAVGHETVHGRVGVTKAVAVELSHYSTDFMGAFPDSHETAYFALAMVRAAYHGETWQPYASFGVGVGRVSGWDSQAGDLGDTMLALSGTVGIAYKVTDTLAIGPFLQYKPCFEPALNQFWDLGVAATFGL